MKPMTPLHSTSLLDGLEPAKVEQRIHPETNEFFDTIAISEDLTLHLFENGTAILSRGDQCIALDDVETMLLGNCILARSQQREAFERIANILQSAESEETHE